eukprot:COSAG02_NODE_689_length_18462_cov_36.417470_3_plen_328_part_00
MSGEYPVSCHETASMLNSIARSVCDQAVTDESFERKYWASKPDDNYSRAIELLNQKLCYIQDPGCFMEGFIEKRQADVRETIASQTHLTITDWLFSIAHREYRKDDFIPTLVPSSIPEGVFNVFEGLAVTYEQCKDVDVTLCHPLLNMICDSLCHGNGDHADYYLKWLAKPLQGVEYGQIGDIKQRVDIVFKGNQLGAILCQLGAILPEKWRRLMGVAPLSGGGCGAGLWRLLLTREQQPPQTAAAPTSTRVLTVYSTVKGTRTDGFPLRQLQRKWIYFHGPATGQKARCGTRARAACACRGGAPRSRALARVLRHATNRVGSRGER